MSDAIEAYRSITADEKIRHIELLREMAEHDEAQAIHNAERREHAKWENVVAEKDAALAEKDVENERLRQELAKLRAQLDDNR